MSNVITVTFCLFHFRVMTLCLCFILILCSFHSCTPHYSVTVWDIFMKFYKNVKSGQNNGSHTIMIVPPLLVSVTSLDYF